MGFSSAVLLYDLCVLAILALDFLLITRSNPKVIAKLPVLLIPVAMGAFAWRLEAGRLEFLAIGLGVMATALFGYFNFLAFVKRGVTLSMVHNHAKPREQRRPDSDYIALDQRIDEMAGHGWIEGDHEGGYRLTDKGVFVLKVRRVLHKLFQIEAVG